ncbi:MAG: adenosine deaminase [Actinomycetota bacterium]
MERDLAALPKVDLHIHLEGAMRASTVADLAARHRVELPEGLRDGRYEFRDFRHFVDEWMAGLRCLRRHEDFRRIAYELCEDEAAEGVRYAEVSFSLPEHGSRLGDWDWPVLAVLEGFADGERDFGVRCRPYVDVVRGLPMELSRLAMEAAVRHRDDGVIGIGLGGDERFPPEDYAGIFRRALESGLRSLPHAGETGGPASIRGALDALGADRIGHGIRCLEDQALVDELRERAIPLEVCPTSNVMTKVIRSIAEHPLPKLLGAGLTIALGSDDPSMFSSQLAGEYELAREVFGLTDEKLAELARTGVRASFAEGATKAEMELAIGDWLGGEGEGRS